MTRLDMPAYDTLSLLKVLIAFDSQSAKPNVPIVEWIESYLDERHIPFTRSRGPEEGKWNLHATIGPYTQGGIAFSGHVDCVPVEGQDWIHDPFTLSEDKGRLFGRGAADMKGFVASMLALVPKAVTMPLTKPLHLFFTFDEEISCNGARYLIQDVKERGMMPSMCVVGEPTSLAPVVAHKGRCTFRIEIKGAPAHSSTPAQGVNALNALAEVMVRLADLAKTFESRGPFVSGFEPPHTTLQIGVAQGGTQLNIVPEHAWCELEWRAVPGHDNDEILEKVKQCLTQTDQALRASPQAGCGVTLVPLVDLPPFQISTDSPFVTLMQQVTGRNTAGFVSYGTEAGIYEQAALPTIVCGPGDIAQAHKPDEWIDHQQLIRCDKMLLDLLQRVCLPS